MKYKILLREIKTGRERLVDMTCDWDDSCIFGLTEGNYGCDCNRKILWDHADGITTRDEDSPCGDMELFTVPWAELADGRRIEIDSTR